MSLDKFRKPLEETNQGESMTPTTTAVILISAIVTNHTCELYRFSTKER